MLFFSPVGTGLVGNYVDVTYRSDETSFRECPESLDVNLQAGIVHQAFGCPSVRQFTVGVTNEDEQLPLVTFLESDVLAVIHLCVLEGIYHHDVGAFLSAESDSQFLHVLVVDKQELLVYLHHVFPPHGLLHGEASTFLQRVVSHTSEPAQVFGKL